MKLPVAVWGLVLTVGFALSYLMATHGFSQAWIWIAWAVIFNLGHFLIMGTAKKTSREIKKVWIMAGIFGLVFTLSVASGIVIINYGFLMTLWMLLIGSACFVEGFEARSAMQIFHSLILLFASIYTLAFGNSYFLAGALLLGLSTFLRGIFTD